MPASNRPGTHTASPFSGFFRTAGASFLLLVVIPTVAAQRQVLPGHLPNAVSSASVVSRVAPQVRLSLAIGLPLRNQDLLDTLLAQIADPTSPNFRHYLKPAEFAAEFGPTEADYRRLIAFVQGNGFIVSGTHPNRVVLDVTGDIATIEETFHLKMMTYRHPIRGEFYAPDREPSVDLAVPVLDISGLDNFEPPHPMSLKTRGLGEATPYVTGSGPAGYFIGKDFRAAYAPGVTLTGAGQTVGLLEFDGFYAGDVQKNFTAAGQTAVPTQTVLLDGFSGTPGGENIEVTLDIMMAAYMAPGLSKVIVYEGTQPNDILNRMATDNLASQLSSSWGFSPINQTTEQIFKQYIAQGQSILQASGDSGAYHGVVMSPSDDPNLTVVGGTSLTTSGSGGAWQSETTWSGSGGGISTAYPIPSYQQGGNMAANMAANGGSLTMRNIPDVALTADIQMYLIQNNGQAVSVGGTSAAAPLWAGFIALANQKVATTSKPRIGFLNPLIYSIGSGSNYGSDFNDIVRGNNSGFSAVTAYDLTTGWGSPAGQHLINDLAGVASAPSFSILATASSLSIKPATNATDTLTIAPASGFSAAVNLSTTGLPAGVTAAFSPASSKTVSTLTLTAGSTVMPGTYPLTVTGVSGSLTSTAAISLSVVTPSFKLSGTVGASSADNITVPHGSSAAITISVVPSNGFSAPVSLTTGALPAGVTAAFTPATTSATSSLVLAVAATTTAGTYPVIVTGTAGALKATETISLTVTAPNFTFSATPATLSLPRGLSATATLAIGTSYGFQGAVTLTATGLPAGVTASIGTTPGARTVTFAATSAATLGASTVTFTGVSGTLKNTASMTLTVIAPPATAALVNLAPNYNVNALAADGAPFTGPGFDGGLNGSSTAYSATLIGTQQTIGGTLFYFGPANAPDAASSGTVVLPAGQFTGIRLLAAAVNGPQMAQVFTVTYTDGTTTAFTQNMSDWFTPQNFTGETKAMIMPYRNNGAGQRDNRTFYLYGYSFALNSARKVSTITLPHNRNVVVLAATLSATTSSVSH